jgi:hypothetical protein
MIILEGQNYTVSFGGTIMSRFHQRLREDLNDPEFAEAFYDMSADIALLQVLEEARKALNVSEKELAEWMLSGVGIWGTCLIGGRGQGFFGAKRV